jgi:LAO/AO transport system kinase
MSRPPLAADQIDELLQKLTLRDRRALSRLMTAVDDGALLPQIRAGLEGSTHRSLRVGVTGAAGAGKSTLCGALLTFLRKQGKSVCVLACDPTSPFTGGALLGDRVRMDYDPADQDAFVRSFSSHGSTGGLASTAADLLTLAEAFGFSVVLLETVGVGQDQVAAQNLVDVLVVLITPAGGDDIQWEKAGVMEAADVVAVNKADLAGADAAAAGLTAMLGLSTSPQGKSPPPIVKIVASRSEGIEELWDAIVARAAQSVGRRSRSRRRRILSLLQQQLADWFSSVESSGDVRDLLDRLAEGSISEQHAANELLRRFADSRTVAR